ncbi:MAG: DUF4139 domain-containing protein, partial [Bacteroidota bacterium]
KKIEDLTSTKVVGSNKKEVLGIEINVRNTKNAPVELTIEDQVPLSVQKAIEVDLEDAEGAVHNEKSGSLRWKMTLQPSSNATRTFRYSVKYPKNNRLSK